MEDFTADLLSQLGDSEMASDGTAIAVVDSEPSPPLPIWLQPFPASDPLIPHLVAEGVWNGSFQALPDPVFPNPGQPMNQLTEADQKDLTNQSSKTLRANRALTAFISELGFRNRPGHRYDTYGLWRAKRANDEYAWLLKEWKRRGVEPPSDGQLRDWARAACGPGFPAEDADVRVLEVEIKD